MASEVLFYFSLFELENGSRDDERGREKEKERSAQFSCITSFVVFDGIEPTF